MTTANSPPHGKKKLFTLIDGQLLTDDMPSAFLKGISMTPEFRAYPFSMLKKLKHTQQSPVHHPEGNVWNHTLLVVDEAAKRKGDSADPRVLLWAALLHDIGKPVVTRIRGEKITAYNHDAVGARLARLFLGEWTDDESFLDKVAALVKYHMQLLYVVRRLPFMDIAGMKRQTDVREVALLGLCDRLGRLGADRDGEEKQVQLFLKLCMNDGGRKGDQMAKQGMRRPDPEAPHGENPERNHFSKNREKPVPELQGKAKLSNEKAKPILYKNADGSSRSV